MNDPQHDERPDRGFRCLIGRRKGTTITPGTYRAVDGGDDCWIKAGDDSLTETSRPMPLLPPWVRGPSLADGIYESSTGKCFLVLLGLARPLKPEEQPASDGVFRVEGDGKPRKIPPGVYEGEEPGKFLRVEDGRLANVAPDAIAQPRDKLDELEPLPDGVYITVGGKRYLVARGEKRPVGEEEAEADGGLGFEALFVLERREIARSRALWARGSAPAVPGPPQAAPPLPRYDLSGLAFSGGGIRSAVFNLGLIQALARLRLLSRFDYLSSVSGGGYIACWLSKWIREARGSRRVEMTLDPRSGGQTTQEASPEESSGHEPHEVGFLRRFSNYLTPKVGLFTADTWTTVAIYGRNLILNLAVLVALASLILLVPRLIVGVLSIWSPSAQTLQWLTLAGGVTATMFVGVHLALMQLASRTHGSATTWASLRDKTSQAWVQALIVVPLLLGAFFAGYWLYAEEVVPTYSQWVLRSAAVYTGAWLLAVAVAGLLLGVDWAWRRLQGARVHSEHALESRIDLAVPFHLIAWAPVAGAGGGLLLWAFSKMIAAWGGGATLKPSFWLLLVWGQPAVVLTVMVVGSLHLGLMGRRFDHDRREWMSRLAAWLMIYGLATMTFFGATVYGPVLIAMGEPALWAVAGSGWLLLTVAGVVIGRQTGTQQPKRWRRMLIQVAPYVFMVGLVALLALGTDWALDRLDPVAAPSPSHWLGWRATPADSSLTELLAQHNKSLLRQAQTLRPAAAAFLLTAVVLLLGLRVDVNEFSLHGLYRNRLVRCFLGASTQDRRQTVHPFTGFDPRDDLSLSLLSGWRGPWLRDPEAGEAYPYPFPILNATLNVVSSRDTEDLAWQHRKAAAFAFTPLYCGYRLPPGADGKPRSAYGPTPRWGGSRALKLGTAMAISGAALSPSMGERSTPAVSFLLTVFNVRLGWWLGNPRYRPMWKAGVPRFGLRYLVSELFGRTTHESDFVYLSDGGHFENLGIYELVRRRCRVIVVSDAGCDREFQFSDLGNAIRKCRSDFGIRITFDDLDQLQSAGTSRFSEWHCAVGTIHYDDVDPDATSGTLLYIKASLTGDEAPDVLQYRAENKDFPHEGTTNQWFSEAQFESYRALGHHVADRVLRPALGGEHEQAPEDLNWERLAVRLRQVWCRPSLPLSDAATRHAEQLDRLYQSLRLPELRFIEHQFHPEWRHLLHDVPAAPSPATRAEKLPDDPDQLRTGLYFCSSLISLMENVYLDLNLEHEYHHPDNRGWMNLFQHWSWSRMFRIVWALSAGNSGARFQNFCRAHLGLDVGAVGAVHLAGVHWSKTRGAWSPRPTRRRQGSLQSAISRTEHAKLRSFLDKLPEGKRLELFQFEVQVEDPLPQAKLGPVWSKFPFGLALVRDREIHYFRIQTQIRRVGLARRAIDALMKRYGLLKISEEKPEDIRERDWLEYKSLVHSVRRDRRRLSRAHAAGGPESGRGPTSKPFATP